MKTILLSIIIAFTSMSFVQQNDAGSIVKALKSADAMEVSTYFDKILDIKFPEKDEIKSIGKNQAGIALKSFFADNNINGFELASQREMGGTMYITGKLLNDSKGYNLTLLLKSKDDKQQIITVRIN